MDFAAATTLVAFLLGAIATAVVAAVRGSQWHGLPLVLMVVAYAVMAIGILLDTVPE